MRPTEIVVSKYQLPEPCPRCHHAAPGGSRASHGVSALSSQGAEQARLLKSVWASVEGIGYAAKQDISTQVSGRKSLVFYQYQARSRIGHADRPTLADLHFERTPLHHRDLRPAPDSGGRRHHHGCIPEKSAHRLDPASGERIRRGGGVADRRGHVQRTCAHELRRVDHRHWNAGPRDRNGFAARRERDIPQASVVAGRRGNHASRPGYPFRQHRAGPGGRSGRAGHLPGVGERRPDPWAQKSACRQPRLPSRPGRPGIP